MGESEPLQAVSSLKPVPLLSRYIHMKSFYFFEVPCINSQH
jgi:hypothetical protein